MILFYQYEEYIYFICPIKTFFLYFYLLIALLTLSLLSSFFYVEYIFKKNKELKLININWKRIKNKIKEAYELIS